MSLDEQFKSVSDTVKNWSKKPSNDENLALYSLLRVLKLYKARTHP
ncbi:unnamed protein product [Plutella xylostella]|uniref:(diamondback moth) hypothetical protein n=1 Tax=Plutella xylostella TaxID=51655 RepID=A0A8S4DDV9_PLUXY|nr:unnamed protein product [Plutella xylostella]